MFKSQAFIPISVILILIIVAGAAIFGSLYTQTWNPSWNPFGLSSQNIFEKGLKNLFLLRTFKTDGIMEIAIKIEEATSEEAMPKNLTLSLSFSNLTDKSDMERVKTEGDYGLGIGIEGMEISLQGEIKTIDENFYFKATSLPTIPLFGELLENFKNQWVKIDQQSLLEVSGKEGEISEEEKVKFSLIDEIIDIIKGKEILQVKDTIGEEKINGLRCYHYLVGFDREELKKSIPEFLGAIEQYIPAEEQGTFQQKLQEFLQDFPQKFDEVYDKLGGIDFEVWLDKKDKCLRKIKGEKEIDLSLFEEFEESGAGLENAKVKISFDIRFSEFNQEVTIEAPEDAKSIEEILPPEMFGILGTPSLPLPLPGQ